MHNSTQKIGKKFNPFFIREKMLTILTEFLNAERCKVQKYANLVDLVTQIANSNEYLLAKFSFDTAENEPCKLCPLSA